MPRSRWRSEILTGLNVFLDKGLPQLTGKRVGLITNHTGIDRRLRSTIDVLQGLESIELATLFGPEHGVRGDAQAGVEVSGAVDQHTGLPVHSLYGETQTPTPAMLEGLDALIFDIQDAGVRFYTYLSTMAYSQAAAAAAGLAFVVLDRPNPISGTRIEGNVLDPDFRSFVGAHPIPIRHGLTFGELARAVVRRDRPPLRSPIAEPTYAGLTHALSRNVPHRGYQRLRGTGHDPPLRVGRCALVGPVPTRRGSGAAEPARRRFSADLLHPDLLQAC